MSFKHFSFALIGIIAGAFITGAVQYVVAWNTPTASAPDNNVAAPINVGAENQSKSGGLDVVSLTTQGGASIGMAPGQDSLCLNGSCITAWPSAITVPACGAGQVITADGSSFTCTASTGGSSTTTVSTWPNGSYCILKAGGSCPAGFTAAGGSLMAYSYIWGNATVGNFGNSSFTKDPGGCSRADGSCYVHINLNACCK